MYKMAVIFILLSIEENVQFYFVNASITITIFIENLYKKKHVYFCGVSHKIDVNLSIAFKSFIKSDIDKTKLTILFFISG